MRKVDSFFHFSPHSLHFFPKGLRDFHGHTLLEESTRVFFPALAPDPYANDFWDYVSVLSSCKRPITP